MDEVIYQMVTKNIEPPKIVVERKGKVTENTKAFLINILAHLSQLIKGKALDLNIGIFKNVWKVIELEWNIKGIRVGYKADGHHHPNSKKVFERKRLTFLEDFLRNCRFWSKPFWFFFLLFRHKLIF